MKMKILVVYHKNSVRVENSEYLPIQVNKQKSGVDLNMQGDDTGDNISMYNSIFCEMTAVYWAWKNLQADYIGLCHYRRLFTNKSINCLRLFLKKILYNIKGVLHRSNYVNQISYNSAKDFVEDAFAFAEQLKKEIELKKYELIVPSPYLFYHSNVKELFETLHRDNISMISEIVKSKYPEIYPFLESTLKGKRFYAANMFVMKKNIFDEYCSFVFDVLFTHISKVQKEKWCINPYHEGCFARVSGYMAEVLTCAFIERQISKGVKHKEVCTSFLKVN